ncbi:MAG: hypothetical protein J1F33_00140 [Clostridiales bacterium]|nr:hypothetical protein [Clostridiales bacterium]
MAKKTGELKKRAWLAKQRLKMGYWDSVRREKAQAEIDGVDSRTVAAVFSRSRLIRDSEPTEATVLEEKLYRRVCEILDSDETAINPIGQLIDGEVYSSLDAAGKQRYVLELSTKFRELRERYIRERTGA